MNFAIPFSTAFKYPDDNIQWNINYKPQIKQLCNFIEKYGTHRINLIFKDFKLDRDCQIVQALREKFPDVQLVMCLPFYKTIVEEKLNEYKLPHYYKELITDWDRFQGFLQLNITDIFIGNNLGFNIKILSEKAKNHKKSLRSFCNVCETSWLDTPSLKTFFIRPEDIDLYGKYIDTFEFFTKNNSFSIQLNTLYTIYIKDKEWPGKLDEIIVNYKGQEDSRFMIPIFGEKRINCGKKCLINNNCKICDRIIELGETFKNKKLFII